jgi:hypothetical protein
MYSELALVMAQGHVNYYLYNAGNIQGIKQEPPLGEQHSHLSLSNLI